MAVNIIKPAKPASSAVVDYADLLVSTPAVGTTHVQKKHQPEQFQQETLSKPQAIAKGDLYQVHMSGSSTINLGNYESAKITVGVTVPCTKSDMDSAFDFAAEWVSNRIEACTQAVKDSKN